MAFGVSCERLDERGRRKLRDFAALILPLPNLPPRYKMIRASLGNESRGEARE